MADEKWYQNPVAKAGMAAIVIIPAILGLLMLFTESDLKRAGAAAFNYKPGEWVNPAPQQIKGTWAKDGRCEDDDSLLVIFSDGGYRWRTSRTDWGFARGKYRYDSPQAYRVFFRLQRLVQTSEDPDQVITVSGSILKKYNLKGGTSETYEKCRS